MSISREQRYDDGERQKGRYLLLNLGNFSILGEENIYQDGLQVKVELAAFMGARGGERKGA